MLRACFGGNDTKPTAMQTCQGIKIIMLTKMDNLGALLCDGAPVMFQDSGEKEMDENFISSDMITYKEVQETLGEVEAVTEIEELLDSHEEIPLDETELDPHTEEYIGGYISKKVYQKRFVVLIFFSQIVFSVVFREWRQLQEDSQICRVTDISMGALKR